MTVLLDNGHGGIINGKYQTAGKRSPVWNNGQQLFEGEFNRAIVKGIIEKLTTLNIPYVNIVPEYQDISLQERINRANKYGTRNVFYLSIRANAGKGQGLEIFTSHGETKSDRIATIFGEEFLKEFPDKKLRTYYYSESGLDKEKKLSVLIETIMPAVLTKNFFMDTEKECKEILLTKEGREKIINYHVEAVVRVKKELY